MTETNLSSLVINKLSKERYNQLSEAGAILSDQIYITTGDEMPITTLPIASSTTLGGIKVGDNLAIAADGTLSASGGGSDVPTKVSELENDVGYLSAHQSLAGYALTSDIKNSQIRIYQGTVLKGSFTLNQASGGDITLDAGGGGGSSGSTPNVYVAFKPSKCNDWNTTITYTLSNGSTFNKAFSMGNGQWGGVDEDFVAMIPLYDVANIYASHPMHICYYSSDGSSYVESYYCESYNTFTLSEYNAKLAYIYVDFN